MAEQAETVGAGSVEELLADLRAEGGDRMARYEWCLSAVHALREARYHAGLSRQEIATALGITERAVARIEDDLDGGMTLGTFYAFARACGVRPATIVIVTDDR